MSLDQDVERDTYKGRINFIPRLTTNGGRFV